VDKVDYGIGLSTFSPQLVTMNWASVLRGGSLSIFHANGRGKKTETFFRKINNKVIIHNLANIFIYTSLPVSLPNLEKHFLLIELLNNNAHLRMTTRLELVTG
jgi:hypothetical protein